uniref:Uncharacterized protein n=1 Tax=Oryzias melastigma TaxID=30732 RepID=A0A3B3CLQ9_ORYME
MDPFPLSKHENDFTLGGIRPQQARQEKSRFFINEASADSLDLHLKSICDHHKDSFCTKKPNCMEEEQENDIRTRVDPKRSSTHKIN